MVASQSAVRETTWAYERRPANSNLPLPEPTRLTIQLVDRTMAAFREVFDVRFAELNRAITLATSRANELPADADADAQCRQLRADVYRQLLSLREFIMSQIEIIRSVSAVKLQPTGSRFIGSDTRIRQAVEDSRISLDADLTAARQTIFGPGQANPAASGRSQPATQGQIDAVAQLVSSSNKLLEDQIADLKSRLDHGAGRHVGRAESKTERRLNVGAAFQAVAVLATFIGLLIVAFHE